MLLLLASCVEYQFSSQVDVPPAEITECGFTPFEDTPALSAYDCNPVFTTSGEDWASELGSIAFSSTQVLGHPFFQIWYEGYDDDGDWSFGYALSENGTDWLPHLENPYWPERDGGAWDARLQRPVVQWDPDLGGYTMLYGGISDDNFFGLGVAGARDGRAWALSPRNPLLDLGLPYDGVDFAWALDLNIQPGLYDVYMGGSTDGDVVDIYRLQTDDIEHLWVPPGRVFSAGDSGAWDDQGFVDASVVELDGRDYMFYIGFARWEDLGDGLRAAVETHVGLATSDDGGASWDRASDDPLPLSMTSTGGAGMVAATRIGPRIHLWVLDYYEDLDAQAIGYFLYEPS